MDVALFVTEKAAEGSNAETTRKRRGWIRFVVSLFTGELLYAVWKNQAVEVVGDMPASDVLLSCPTIAGSTTTCDALPAEPLPSAPEADANDHAEAVLSTKAPSHYNL
jgi:hypothetical protein